MFLNIQKVPEQVCKHFKLLSEKCLRTTHNVHEKICWGTFQNVPLELFKMFLNIQKVPEHVCKHFKSKCRVKKCLRTNSEFFRKKFWELLKMFMWKFVGEHFRMFHWNFLKCSWTFKKFSNKFVNISKCRVKKYLRTIHNVLDNC